MLVTSAVLVAAACEAHDMGEAIAHATGVFAVLDDAVAWNPPSTSPISKAAKLLV